MKNSYLLLSLLLSPILWSQAPNMEWIRCLGGSSPDNAMAVQITPDGGCIILGDTSSSDGDISQHPGYIDFWVVKLDAQGNISWEKTLGSNNTDYPGSIVLSNDGGYVITGTVTSCNRDVLCTNENDNLWVMKLNSSGILQWQKTYGRNYGNDIQQTADGGYVIAGTTFVNSGDSDAVVLKIDSNGNQQWYKVFSGNNEQQALSVIQTIEGEYLVAFMDHQIYDTSILKLAANGDLIWQKNIGGALNDRIYDIRIAADGNYILAGDNNSDAWLIKTTSDGVMLWQKAYGGSGSDLTKSVVALPDGGFVASGLTNSDNDGNIIGPHPNYDAWLFRVDSQGNLLWQKYVGANGIDLFNDVKQTPDNGFLAVGYTTSATINPAAVNHGSDDFIVAKFSAEMLGNATFEIKNATIYPNPTTGVLNVESETGFDALTIYSIDGRKLLAVASNRVDVSHLCAGSYILKATNKGIQVFTRKFLKQ